MILEYVLNPANLIFIFFLSLRGKGTSQSKAHGQDVCFLFFFLKELKRPFRCSSGRFLFQKMYLLFMFPIFPAGKHMLSFRLGKLQCHVKTT